MSWIINGLAFVGCLTLIAIALLAWAVWRDDTSPTTTTHAQIPTHPSTGQVPSGKLCTGLFGELERHTESTHS